MLYGNDKSANTYKVRLLFSYLGKDYDYVRIRIGAGGEAEGAEYRSINPLGQVPALVAGAGHALTQSGAILYFVANNTRFLPTDEFARAKVLQWMFFEQYELEPNLGWARWILHLSQDSESGHSGQLPNYLQGGRRALGILDAALAQSPFVAGNDATIADIALFGYAHLADQAQIPLADFDRVSSWIERMKSLPGYVEFSGE